MLDDIQINPVAFSAEYSPVELGKIASPRIRGNTVTQKAECFYEKELQNHRITERLGIEGTSKDHKIQCSPSLVELRNAYMQK